jgi:hypothetical protein
VTPCRIKWCGALATRGDYCPVHYDRPHFDSRTKEEALSSRDRLPASLPSLKVRRDKRVPVDDRPLIHIAEEP